MVTKIGNYLLSSKFFAIFLFFLLKLPICDTQMSGCSQFVANPKPRRNKSTKKAANYLESTENPLTFASDLRFIHKLELVFSSCLLFGFS